MASVTSPRGGRAAAGRFAARPAYGWKLTCAGGFVRTLTRPVMVPADVGAARHSARTPEVIARIAASLSDGRQGEHPRYRPFSRPAAPSLGPGLAAGGGCPWRAARQATRRATAHWPWPFDRNLGSVSATPN